MGSTKYAEPGTHPTQQNKDVFWTQNLVGLKVKKEGTHVLQSLNCFKMHLRFMHVQLMLKKQNRSHRIILTMHYFAQKLKPLFLKQSRTIL